MNNGTLYAIGVGPGDPELITVKGANLISSCRHLFVPKARIKSESAALSIIERYIKEGTDLHELVFPMTNDENELKKRWEESGRRIADVLKTGSDACFVTLGDPSLYSTFIYLVRALRGILEDAKVVIVPGVAAFSAAAALTGFPIGEGREQVTIVPTGDDLDDVRRAVSAGGTVVLMKIGKRLGKILDLLEELKLMESAVFVSYAGMEKERIETDLHKLRNDGPEAGYLSIILLHAKGNGKK